MEECCITVPEPITLLPPQGYLDFVSLLSSCETVITDSGGLQKEAYILGKPCITLRPETEWVETIEEGWNTLADPLSADFAEIWESFRPPDEPRADIFGANVSELMVQVLYESLSPQHV